MDILLASGNEHKKQELEALLYPHKLHLPGEYGLSFDCDETGSTFLENATQKADSLLSVAKDLNMPVLADDSGLTVDALPGELGIHTARYGSKEGEPVLPADVKNALLLKNMENIPDEKRHAYFSCVLVLKTKDWAISAEGIADGYILREAAKGNGGFGYDPVFFNYEANCSLATVPSEVKNKYGHRGKAARALLKQLDQMA